MPVRKLNSEIYVQHIHYPSILAYTKYDLRFDNASTKAEDAAAGLLVN